MTILNNNTLTMPNSSIVFTAQNAYTSMDLYYAVIVLFSVFIIASLFLDGKTKPFEKLFAAIMAFLFSLSNALSSFSLAIMSPESAGFLQQTNLSNISQQTAIVPVIIMQNTMTWQVISWVLVVLCFVNIINCILVLLDYSRITSGGKKGAL
jgi:hypothetical protein